jgi:nucleoside phosphorylase
VSVLALVGIAGALHRDLRLGDVVIASTVDSYLASSKITDGKAPHSGADGAETWHIERAGESLPLSNSLKAYTNNFPYVDGGDPYADWRSAALARKQTLIGASDDATGQAYRLMPVATGDAVVTSDAFAAWLREGNRLRGAVEMEAGGMAHAVYSLDAGRPTDFLVIRGISDYADSRKSSLDQAAPQGVPGAWRKLASQNAFALLLALTGHSSFPWRGAPSRRAAATERLEKYRRRASRAVLAAEAAMTMADTTAVSVDVTEEALDQIAMADHGHSHADGQDDNHVHESRHDHRGDHGEEHFDLIDPFDTDGGSDTDGGADAPGIGS